MSDLIDRQAAIDALNEYFVRIGKMKRRGLNKGEKAISLDTVGAINSLPPAQPHTYRGVTLNDVMMYFDSLEGNEDAWTEFCSCFECRGWGFYHIRSANDTNVGDTDARQDFMDIVYAELESDPDNNRANRIIWAADGYAESAQLGTNFAEVGMEERTEEHTKTHACDCISRQAVKELAHNQVREKYCGMAFKEQRDFYIKLADSIIDLLPSAQPEQRTGKWVMNDHIGTFKIFTCSECGWNSEAPFNFCPNCGAKMEGASE